MRGADRTYQEWRGEVAPEKVQALVAAIAGGDQEAEEAFVRTYYQRVMRLFRCRIRDRAAAEDLCHDCFIVMLQRLRHRGLYDSAALEAFLRGTVRRMALAYGRQKFKTSVDLLDMQDFRDEEATAHDHAEHVATECFLRAALRRLPAGRDREILVRRYLLGQDSASIQHFLHLSEGAFKVALHRARRRLRDLVHSSGEVDHLQPET